MKLKILDMNKVMRDVKILSMLRNMTLDGVSGMQATLDKYQDMIDCREKIRATAIIAYMWSSPVAWGLLSWESTDGQIVDYDSTLGVYFQIFVEEEYRRQGIGSKLIARARKIVGSERLNVCCWSEEATLFYRSNLDKNPIGLPLIS